MKDTTKASTQPAQDTDSGFEAITFEVLEPEQKNGKQTLGRGVYLIPNMATTLSLFSGFASILSSFNGNFELAVGLIFASCFLDGIDGRLARMLNAQSSFGEQYDSLADLVAFGMAPAFLAYSWSLDSLGRVGVGAAFIYLACAAFRLARFNTQIGKVSKKYFQGLASPIAAVMVTALVLLSVDRPEWLNTQTTAVQLLFAVWTLAAGLLMVSNIRYFSFKELDSTRVPFGLLIIFVMVLAVVIIDLPIGVMLLVTGYALSGIYATWKYRSEKQLA